MTYITKAENVLLVDQQGQFIAESVEGALSEVKSEIGSKANSENTALTGIPTAPTADSETNTTQIATTAFVQTSATNTLSSAENYADGLATNYDPAGSASTAESNAKNYADGLAVNYDPVGSAATAESNANSYTDTAVGYKLDTSVYNTDHSVVTKVHNNFAIATGTNDYSVTLSPAPSSYVAGMIVSFLSPSANTAECTLNCNGLGAKPIYKNAIEILTNGIIKEGQVVSVVYDGSNFQITSGSGGGGGGISIPFYNRVVTSTETNTIPIGLSVISTSEDVVFVYQNSVYISNGIDYTVSGTNIVKSSGNWTVGTTIDIVVFISMTETSKFYLVKDYSSFTATENSTTLIPIGTDNFDQTIDVLDVYYQNLKLFKGSDYTIALNNSSITLTSFSINIDEVIQFEIFRKIKEGSDSNWTTTGDVILSGSQLVSTVETGEAPFTVQSTTAVTNLNADLLDGQHANYFATSAHNHSGVYSPIATTVEKTSSIGAAAIPSGTTDERPGTALPGYIRYNSETASFEGYNGSVWSSIAGGQMLGQATMKAIAYNSLLIEENITIPSGVGAYSAGEIEIAIGYEVTISPGVEWVIL